MKILAVGGGSGGHVTPVAAVLSSLAGRTSLSEVTFVCDTAFSRQARGIMKHVDLGVSIDIKVIAAGKFRRYSHFGLLDYLKHPSIMAHNLVDSLKFAWGVLQSLVLLVRRRPDVIFAKGGYVCLPIGFVARLLKIPLVIHDSDARPGLTSRLLARFATKIATGYPIENYPYPPEKTIYTGVPIASDAFTAIDQAQQLKLKQRLHLNESQSLVVAVGGGLGARSINDAMIEALPKLADQSAVAYIVAGEKNYDQAKRAAESYHNAKVIGFLSEGLPLLLAAADIVVTRASATTLQELAALAKPIIVVPARALGDQQKNAKVYADANAAIILSDDDITVPGRLGREIVRLLGNETERQRLSQHIEAFNKPNASDEVAQLIVSTLEDKTA